MRITSTLLQARQQPTQIAPKASTSTQQTPQILKYSPVSALSAMAHSDRSKQPSIRGLGASRIGGDIPQTRRLDSFVSTEQRVGLATALSHTNSARNASNLPTAEQLQDTFTQHFSTAEAQALATLLQQANVHLQPEPLLDQTDQPGLVFSVKGMTKSPKTDDGKVRQQEDIQQIVNLLLDKQIQPSLYTGHQLGGDLAQWAHKQMRDPGAVTVTFDAKTKTVTNSLKQINVPIDKKARELGGLIQEKGFDNLLANTVKKSAEDDSEEQLEQQRGAG